MKQLILSVFLFFHSFSSSAEELKNFTIITDSHPIHYQVEIADTSQKQQQGLMFRKSLPQNQGMLFVFPKEEIIHMWMKNTFIPLDMLFIDKKNTIIKIQENTIPFSEEIISSVSPTLNVLEINGGQVQKNHIQVGMKAFLN